MKVLTNNPMAYQTITSREPNMAVFHDVSPRELMVLVRDRIHLGHKLLTHPLSGSVKPSESPYKSIGISDTAGERLCVDSLLIIEQAIAVCDGLVTRFPHPTTSMLNDYQLIDWTLILSALEGSDAWRQSVPISPDMLHHEKETSPGAASGQPRRLS